MKKFQVICDGEKMIESQSMSECVTEVINAINDIFMEETNLSAIGSKILYVNALKSALSNIDVPLNAEVVEFLNHKFVFEEVVDKYVVTYEETFDNDVDPDTIPFYGKTITIICNEEQKDALVRKYRSDIEDDIEGFYTDESFEERLGKSVDIMMDSEEFYEVYDHIGEKFFRISVQKEVE